MSQVPVSVVLLASAAACAPAEQDLQEQSDCAVALEVSLSENVPTVIRVGNSETLAGSRVVFEAVEDASDRHDVRLATGTPTWIVGLAASTRYRYRVTTEGAEGVCSVATGELTTGAPPVDLPIPEVVVRDPRDATPGFLVTSVQVKASVTDAVRSYLAAYDHRGRAVWWHLSPVSGLVSRVRWLADEGRVFARDANPRGLTGGKLLSVTWDGSVENVYTVETSHHDFALGTEGEIFLLGGGGNEQCGRLMIWRPGESATNSYDLRSAFGATFEPGQDPCHCNAINYNAFDDSITVSCLMQNAFLKFSRATGSTWGLDWVLGGNNSQGHFTGDVAWNRQHGHHWLPGNQLLFFNNNGGGDSPTTGSLAVELQLEPATSTVRRIWEYAGGEVSQTLGDVQRLPDGNTLVGYSNAGVVHETGPDQRLLRVWSFDGAIGYIEYHSSLLPVDGGS